jgi:hypothetical protein
MMNSEKNPVNASASLRCPRCRLTLDQPEIKSCPFCGYEITKRAVRESPAADSTPWVPEGSPAAWPTMRGYRLTDGLEPKATKRLILIRLALGLALLTALLLARVHATGSLPFVQHSLPAITLPK